MQGITSPDQTKKLRETIREIAEHPEIYSDAERITLLRYGKLMRNFTIYESNEIWRIFSRIPVEKKDVEPWMSKGVKKKFNREFF